MKNLPNFNDRILRKIEGKTSQIDKYAFYKSITSWTVKTTLAYH
jgi:hypothetical protein